MTRRPALVLATLFALAHAAPAHALRLSEWRGHLSVGYAKLSGDALAPGGSLSAGGGVDHPVAPRWRVGPSLAFHLLGSSQVERDLVGAGLDYSAFDAMLMAHYQPARGPFTRLSAGPGLATIRADLQVAGGGALFRDLAVGEVRPCAGFEALLAPRTTSIVQMGLALGARIVPREDETWSLWTARLAIHF
jgi:hypothetical protein